MVGHKVGGSSMKSLSRRKATVNLERSRESREKLEGRKDGRKVKERQAQRR